MKDQLHVVISYDHDFCYTCVKWWYLQAFFLFFFEFWFLGLLWEQKGRVWIIASHFTNCKVNSSYCSGKVVNYMKNAKQFFSQRKFNSSMLDFSTLYPSYPHFTHPLYTVFHKKYCLYPKLHHKMQNSSQFL